MDLKECTLQIVYHKKRGPKRWGSVNVPSSVIKVLFTLYIIRRGDRRDGAVSIFLHVSIKGFHVAPILFNETCITLHQYLGYG